MRCESGGRADDDFEAFIDFIRRGDDAFMRIFGRALSECAGRSERSMFPCWLLPYWLRSVLDFVIALDARLEGLGAPRRLVLIRACEQAEAESETADFETFPLF